MIASTADLLGPTLRDFVPSYCKARPQKPGSLQQILLSIDMLERWAGEPVRCGQLDREFLLAFRQWRMETREPPVCPKHCYPMRRVRGTSYRCTVRDCPGRGVHVGPVKAATANKDLRNLIALWNEAVDHGLNAQPKKRIKRLDEELDNLPCWSMEEFSKIIAASKLEPNEDLFPCPPEDFWPATLLLAYETASRIKALLKAKPEALDWSTGTITLRAKTTKGKKCDVKTLTPATLAAVRKVYNPHSAYLLPCVVNVDTLRDRLKRILKRAGLPADRIDLFHKIRRTTLTHVVKETGSLEAAKEYAQHSDISVTRRYIDRTKLGDSKSNASVLPRPTL